MTEIIFSLKNFEKMTKQMQSDLQKHYAKVGVLAAKNARTEDDDNVDNAYLAAIHEYGVVSQNLPARSFFRLTQEKRGEEMAAFIASNESGIMAQVMAGRTIDVLKKLGAKWVSYINECFETEGFGTWAPLSESTIEERRSRTPKAKRKKGFNPKILQDTGQLERSITFEVK